MGVDTNPHDSFMMIDLEENKWKGLKPMPTARYATFSFLVNEKLYVIGNIPVVIFHSFFNSLFSGEMN